MSGTVSRQVRLPHAPEVVARWSQRRAVAPRLDPPLRLPAVSLSHRSLIGRGPDGGTLLTDEVRYDVAGPSWAERGARQVIEQRLRRCLAYRARQIAADLDFHATHPGHAVIAVSGASGLVGRQVVALLAGGGHDVRPLVRRAADVGEIAWDPAAAALDPAALREVDVVIHLSGEPIGGRFTPEHKERVLTSRTRSTALLARTMASLAADGRQRALIVASASGYYGADRGDEVLTEESGPGEDFLAQVCQAWEDAAAPARDAGVRVAQVRTGLVQSALGGQLALQLPIYRAGLGGRLGDGRQWLPWISLDDLAGLYAHLALTPALAGPVNACAPQPVRAAAYAQTLGQALHRPAVLPVPRFGPALLLGGQGADELALAGQRMSASRAVEWGCSFRHLTLADGLAHVLALAE